MTATVDRPHTAPPALRSEELRLRQLRTMKRRATGLLVVVTVAWLALTLWGSDHGWQAYARTGFEASMVGGLADWFAVTALFRRPLGLPIPHTAVIPERKDQFGRTLGEFVQENFLSADVVVDRVRGARITDRVAAWLVDRDNAALVAGQLAGLVVGAAEVVRDEDVHELVEGELRRLVDSVPVAPLAGRALRVVSTEGRSGDLLDALLRGVQLSLEDNREELRDRFSQESPWWLPDAAQDRIFERVLDGFGRLLTDVNANPEHELRQRFEASLADLAERLETSPEMRDRGEELKREVLERPEVRQWSSRLWEDAKATLRTQAGDPDSRLRVALTDVLVAAGRRLRDDPELAARGDHLAESGVRYVTEHFHDEIADLVTGTIERWEGEETSRRLELLLGRDLQFIRMNGTVVGGLAGLALHALSQLIS